MVIRRKLVSILLLTLVLFIVGVVISDEAYALWFDPSWGFRQMISIDSLQVPGDLTNFPVLIQITDSDLRVSPGGNVGKANGGDILFTSADGMTKLDHEIESYNSVTGELVAWVEVPFVSSTADTVLYMYYGNAGAADQWNINGTWNSNYGIVYHMDTSGTDSTANGRNRVADDGSPTADNTFMGLGLSFDGDDAWNQADLGGPGGYWEQAWSVRSHEIVFKTGSDVTTRQVLFAEGGSINGVMLYVVNGTLYARWWSESNGWGGAAQSTGISTNTIYHVILSFANPGNYGLFANGSSVGSTSTPTSMSDHGGDGGVAYTGTDGKDFHDLLNSQGHYFIGSIYEFRIRDVVTDSNYATTTYNNQNNPSSFLSFGAPAMFTPVPTMTQWGMIIFVVFAGLGSIYYLKRQRAV